MLLGPHIHGLGAEGISFSTRSEVFTAPGPAPRSPNAPSPGSQWSADERWAGLPNRLAIARPAMYVPTDGRGP